MAAQEPIDPRVRLAIAQWPDDAPRGTVSTFCAEHSTSRKSFYELRKRAKVQGPAAPVPTDLPTGTHVRKLTINGTIMLARVTYMVGGQYGFQQVLVSATGDNITVTDLHGEILIKHTRPASQVTYVGNGKSRGRSKSDETSPKS